MLRQLGALLAVLGLVVPLAACGGFSTGDAKSTQPLSADLVSKISAIGSTPAAPMVIRIFKQDSQLEVWKETSGGKYALLNTYNICSWSGGLGPKVTEGDRQAPEGFYDITPGLMNPKSNYYLAFNTGFPNKFDRAYNRTGADLMVHGDCSSSGCYAMTDKEIGEIYALMRETFAGGSKSIQLEAFPFHMTADNLAKVKGNSNLAFWQNIKTGYDSFETNKTPPHWDVCDKKYVFGGATCGGSAKTADAKPADTKADAPVPAKPAATPAAHAA
jgi:murein L,D-transpeptidase YafK